MTEQTPSSAPDPQPPVTAPQHTGPQANPPAPAAAAPATAEIAGPADGVTVTIDGFEIRVPKGTLDHPGGRAAGHPDPAVLRSPAA